MTAICIFNLCFLISFRIVFNLQAWKVFTEMTSLTNMKLPGLMKIENYTFVWSISDFSSRSESNGELLTSEEFAIKGPDNKISRWRVELYPKGRDYSDHIALFLRKQTAEVEVNAQYVLYSLNAYKAELQ